MNIVLSPVNKIYGPALKKYQSKPFFGQNKDSFERTPIIKSVEDISTIIGDKANEIGRGYYHIAYNIPQKHDCVLRIPRKFNLNRFKNADVEITDNEDKNLKINVGQKLAAVKLKDPQTGKSVELEILKKQQGKPFGIMPYVAYNKAKATVNMPNYDSKEMKEKHRASVEAIAKFPVSSYEKLIETVQEAAKSNYSFDFINSNNILYDEKTQSINLVDLDYGKGEIDYGKILYALTDSSYIKIYNSIGYDVGEEERTKTGENISKITDKFMAAMENKGLNAELEKSMMSFFTLFSGAIF